MSGSRGLGCAASHLQPWRVGWLAFLALAAIGCGGTTSDASSAPFGAAGSPGRDAVGGAAPYAAGSGGSVGPAAPPAKPGTPYSAALALHSARKVKTLLTGMMVSDSDLDSLSKDGSVGMQKLIQTWTTDPAFAPKFRDKMLFFFRNAYQQIGFQPTEDFKMQLLENGGFDLNPGRVGDDAFARIVDNLQDSFALTAWQLVSEGKPLIDTLTTQRFMMTTALKSLYLQIEMPPDRSSARNAAPPLAWKIDYSGNPIPLEQTLDPQSPNYLVFDDQLPVNVPAARSGATPPVTCRGGATLDAMGVAITSAAFTGQGRLFQRLLGLTTRFPQNGATTTCNEHSSRPYFTTEDLSDWQWVSVRPLNAGETLPRPFDLPLLRKTTELALKLPRVGFYTTPAFLALWNTNDSNQHRVTANQTLLVALGSSFTSSNAIIPLSTTGLDAAHAVDNSECYGCHKSLDPMRAFWGNQFDFNDRNDYPTRGFMMTAPNPRPTTLGGVFAFLDVNQSGANMLDFGGLLAGVTDGSADKPLNGFARAMVQKLCFYANSTACDAQDPEFRRIVLAFQNDHYSFVTLIRELFSSPLVTGEGGTKTFPDAALPPSIARRDHFCAALSNRLGKPDLCALAVPMPTSAQQATARIAGSVPADAFSRGAEDPITPSTPTLFHRAAVEMLCENIAAQVVDGANGTIYTSADWNAALADIVDKVMGYPSSHPDRVQALQILTDHYTAVKAQSKNSGSQPLRSAFVLACESPTSVAIGL